MDNISHDRETQQRSSQDAASDTSASTVILPQESGNINPLEYYWEHKAELDALSDSKALFLIGLVDELKGATLADLSRFFGSALEDVELLWSKVVNAGFGKTEPSMDVGTARVRLSAKGMKELRRLGLSTSPPPHSLLPRQLVAGRYRIIRLIGRGGMGEIYEAEDNTLNEHVALKVILPEIASDARARARFIREIQIARKVTHPNVCRIFDIGHHQEDTGSTSNSSPANVIFLTMELLKGETLAQHLNRIGRMTTSEALPLVEQIAAGLDAAHQAGIIHRDFKPGNVILVPGQNGIRAVITDFGLARPSGASEAPSELVPSESEMVGTPA